MWEYAKNRKDERICRPIFVILEKIAAAREKKEKRIAKIAQKPEHGIRRNTMFGLF